MKLMPKERRIGLFTRRGMNFLTFKLFETPHIKGSFGQSKKSIVSVGIIPIPG